MHGVVDPCYLAPLTTPPDDIRRGEVYNDQPLYLPARHGIRLSNVDPSGGSADYEITGRTEDIFRHSPLKYPVPLPDGEALIVAKAKWRRPVLVVSDGTGSELQAGPGIVAPTDTFLCAPIYGCDQFDKGLIERVRDYEFPNLFFLPASTIPKIDEGFVRLDHLQSIRRSDLRQRRCTLADGAIEFFDEWLIHFTTGHLPADSLVEMYRDGLASQARS